MSMSEDTSQHAAEMIIVDDVTSKPVLDFEAYGDTIVKIIEQSTPKFSIGI
jgi:hypothetical protein